MILRKTSIQPVIAKIIRDTRIHDSSFLIDMNEWIPEVMEMLGTDDEKSYAFEEVKLNFYKGKMPCGLYNILAIEYNGCRMSYKNGLSMKSTSQNPYDQDPQLWISTVGLKETIPGNYVWQSSAEAVSRLPMGGHTYSVEMGYINSSLCDATIGVHMDKVTTDENGFPYVPDNANYREAVYYYVRAKMGGAGYNDREFNEATLMQRFDLYAGRALNEITYPSPDQMQSRIKTLNRLMFDEDYWNNMFDSPAEQINY